MIVDIEADTFPRLQELSRILMGNQDRLPVTLAVAQMDPADLYGKAIADELKMSPNRVGAQLKVLEEAGLVLRLPKVGSERRQYFQRTKSSFWRLCEALCDEIDSG
jgi:DNA-binding MarR family transcriptional regulator